MHIYQRLDTEREEMEINLGIVAMLRFLEAATQFRDEVQWLCRESGTFRQFDHTMTDLKIALKLPPDAYGLEVDDE